MTATATRTQKKSIGLTSKVQLCTCSTHFGRLLCRHCTTVTWNYRVRKRTPTIFSLCFGLKYSTQEIIRMRLANWASGNYYCFSKHRCSNQEELFFNIQLDDCKCVRRQFNLLLRNQGNLSRYAMLLSFFLSFFFSRAL